MSGVLNDTCNAICSYIIKRSKFRTHISKVSSFCRLHEYTLLHHSEPYISVSIFNNSLYFCLWKTYVITIEWVCNELTCIRIVNVESDAVAPKQYISLVVYIYILDRHFCCRLY